MRVKPYRIPLIIILFLAFAIQEVSAQSSYELNSGWHCDKAANVNSNGQVISSAGFPILGWQNATVPGTVLTTQLNNKLIPDPIYGMNNEQIPDIYKTGRDYYTYWFVKDFKEPLPPKQPPGLPGFQGCKL